MTIAIAAAARYSYAMFDVTSNQFWKTLHSDLLSLLIHPGMEIQLLLSGLAVSVALLISLLVQRMAKRKMPPGSKHHWIAGNLLPAILSPVMIIFFLILAGWMSVLLVPIHQKTIAAVVKIALVWLAARLLLLLAQRHFMAYLVSSVMLVLALLSVTNLLAPTAQSLNEITFETSTFRLSLLGAIKGIFTLIVLFWGAGILSKSAESWIRRLHLSFNARELAIKFMRIALYFVAGLLTLNEMGVDLTALAVFGSALAVGIGFGLQKITSNFISGIILLFEKTIEAGDLIEVGGEKGWVRQMAIRHTLIETSDGREMMIPNEDLITGKVTNWTYNNTRARVDIVLTVVYASDVSMVQKILLNAAKTYPHCLEDPAPACNLREFADRGFQFVLMFWIPDIKAGLSSAKSDVMFEIVREFRKNNIVFAVAG